jgi:hypothetical protein
MELKPWMFDVVLIGVAAEFLLLAFLLARNRHRAWVWPVFWFLLSGALLMTATRSALSGVSDAMIGAILFVSLLTHLACLRSAWQIIRRLH